MAGVHRVSAIYRPQVLLTHGTETLGYRQHVSERIWRVTDLHIGIGIQAGKRDSGSRAVVLERSREQPLTVCRQRTGQGIAFVSLVVLYLELKRNRTVTIDG